MYMFSPASKEAPSTTACGCVEAEHKGQHLGLGRGTGECLSMMDEHDHLET